MGALGNLRTVTSTMSVSDYFAKKMAEIKAKRCGAAPTAVDTFCDNTMRRFNEEKPEEKEEMTEEKSPDDGGDKEDKPEIYRQEKFHSASLSVQQYFELKMKEKKARAEAATAAAAAAETETNNNTVEEKPVAEDVVEASLKKKKKKKNEKVEAEESKIPEMGDGLSEEGEKPKKKKKKKTKEHVDSDAEVAKLSAPVAEVDVGKVEDSEGEQKL